MNEERSTEASHELAEDGRGEEGFRQLADAMPQLVWMAASDGTVTYYNSQAARYDGFQRRPDGTWIWDVVLHPDDREATRIAWGDAVAARRTYQFEHRVRMADGSYRWHLSRAYCVGGPTAARWFGTATDVHDLKETQHRLRESEQRFKAMAETAPAMLWITDEAHECTFVSRGWLEFTGQTFEEGLGMGWTEAIFPGDRGRVAEAFLAAAERRESFQIDYRLRRADGEHRWVADFGRPRFDAEGRFLGYIGSVNDVHERKRAEQELQRLNAELSDANRRKDEFLATLAHELRNPLAPVRNSLELMKRAKESPAVMDRARATIERQIDQMVRLVDDLLDVSRISRDKLELKRERVELTSVVLSAVETCRPLSERAGHTLSVSLPPEPIALFADPVRLAQVFGNLLTNACKYTEPGGRIRLSAERQGDDVVVTVEDTGVGIPPDMLSRVFDLFTQVDRSLERAGGGLGIGLSLVKRLVEMHGGTVSAHSEGPGRGSAFVVRLPALTEERRSELPAESAAEAHPPAARRVLVVDDNRDSAESLAALLTIAGHETRTAHDGAEALEVAGAFRPEVIVLDIGLPKMNGHEVCRRIRGEPWGKGIVIVALSGWGQEEDRRKSRDAGFDAHLVKPVDPSTLAALLAPAPAATGTFR